MKQPELGKKIAELRKSKGLTQEELVDKCNLNIRTLQRIESGVVTPRIHTLRIIFTALDYDSYDSFEISNRGFLIPDWLEQFYRYVLDLFNLKTNKMRKILVLSTVISLIGLGLLIICSESKAQNLSQIKEIIEQQNKNSIRWFNTDQIDSLLNSYSNNACFYRFNYSPFCGKSEIYYCLQNAMTSNLFSMIDINLISLNVADTIAIEKSITTSKTQTGEILKTVNMQEWHFIRGRWLIVNPLLAEERDKGQGTSGQEVWARICFLLVSCSQSLVPDKQWTIQRGYTKL
jgi:transcriptional regulator with XRE-family HTH domain